MRWVIGDVHGCARELERLLRKMQFDERKDKVWFAGDLINRGPDSLDSLRIWNELGGRGVLGNHDAYAIQAARGERRRPSPEVERLLSKKEGLRLLEKLAEAPLLTKIGKLRDAQQTKVWLVHAGMHPDWIDPKPVAEKIEKGPRDRDWFASDGVRFATKLRYCLADGTFVRSDDEGEPLDRAAKPWDAFYRGDALIVHGHWARRGAYRGKRTLGVDSGCVYGGRLTAWCLEDDRMVSVRGRK